MDYLLRVRDAELPITVTDPADINCLALLVAAKLVVADVPPPVPRPGNTAIHPAAILYGITQLG